MNVVRLIVGIVGTAIAIGVSWFWRSRLKRGILGLANWSIRTSEFWDLLETFCNESAVLWSVFPLLDSLYDRAKDKPPPSNTSIAVSVAVALGFFVAGVYSKKKAMKLSGPKKPRTGA